jgi:PAP2 superfamily.
MMIDPDQVIHNALNSTTFPEYYGFFSAITYLGSATLWLLFLALCIIAGKWRKIAILLFIVLMFSMVINDDIKEIVQRMRPGGVVVSGYFTDWSYSFPSGHAQTAFAIAAVLSAYIPRRYNLITYLLAAAVGMSRIYLGVHYFTDVIAGAAVGTLIGMLAVIGLNRLGLYNGDGLFEIAPRPREKDKVKMKSAKIAKYAAIAIIAGFFSACIAFILSSYIFSLAIVGITFAIIMLLPPLIEGRTHSSGD